jgi:hypothetical protein
MLSTGDSVRGEQLGSSITTDVSGYVGEFVGAPSEARGVCKQDGEIGYWSAETIE